MDNRPIGFLDSGVGGLTVVKELMRQLPGEEVIYIDKLNYICRVNVPDYLADARAAEGMSS